jgi:hypothetical protein
MMTNYLSFQHTNPLYANTSVRNMLTHVIFAPNPQAAPAHQAAIQQNPSSMPNDQGNAMMVAGYKRKNIHKRKKYRKSYKPFKKTHRRKTHRKKTHRHHRK